MRILFIGDYSNYHATLARYLRALGHTVTVASAGQGWLDLRRDIDLSRPVGGKIGGALLWARLQALSMSRLRGYDVVQVASPTFVDLKPVRIQRLLRTLRAHNGSIYLTALGFDSAYLRMSSEPGCPLRYNEWQIEGSPSPLALARPDEREAWLSEMMDSHCRQVYDSVDGITTALYEYHIALQRYATTSPLTYVGIPVDCDTAAAQAKKPSDTVTIMVPYHPGREKEKGIDILRPIIDDIGRRYGSKVRIDYVSGLTYEAFVQRLRQADIVIDQLYSYTPATTALMAMAMGKVVVSGGEDDYYAFIGEQTLRPIINANPTHPAAVGRAIERLVDERDVLARLSSESMAFARRHNDVSVVASRIPWLQ